MSSSRKSLFLACAALVTVVSGVYFNGSDAAPCDSPLYCYGPVLDAIQRASPFEDSKTFVDMPTTRPLQEVLAAFDLLEKPISNNTALNDFLSTYFADAGEELESVPRDQLTTDPVFLDKLSSAQIREFVQKVIEIWPSLTRQYNDSAPSCADCVNSFIPIQRPFVVAGGRFREAYYWDSFWIIEGLLRTGGSFTEISKNIIENFLDFVETIGFVPNGSRIYYLNRSQPPMLTQMVRIYIEHTNDTSILDRALPLLIKEYDFFANNRSINVTVDSQTYQLNQYNVQNNQPRPESYREDWRQANNQSYYASSGMIYPAKALDDTEKGLQYKNLATGAESGWDYSSRFLATPSDADSAGHDVYFPLRSLNVINLVTVDLNSILYWNEVTIAGFLDQTNNGTLAQTFADKAKARSEAMYELMWNDTLGSYFDYNLTSNTQNTYMPLDGNVTATDTSGAPEGQQVLFSPAQLYPFWTGAAPSSLKNNPAAVKNAFSRAANYLEAQPGAISATNYASGQQWDEPNVWPPLLHIMMEGLLNTPATYGEDDPSYIDTQALALRMGQRYLDSTFCTWYATGGSTSVTPRLASNSSGGNGTMFEKYSSISINEAGGGGEYEVVDGFGWSNGVLIWTADTFGDRLTPPNCSNQTAAKTGNQTAAETVEDPQRRSLRSALQLHPVDARRIKMFGPQ